MDHAVLKPQYADVDLESHAPLCVARGVGDAAAILDGGTSASTY